MRHLLLTATALSLLAVGLDCAIAQDTAEAVYRNGKIYIVDGSQPWAEAVAIKDGKFVEVGSNADMEALIGPDTEVIDLDGGFVMPGIHDTHLHPAFAYLDSEAGWVDINPSMSLAEVEQAIRDWIEANPGDSWVRGEGWGLGLFEDGKAKTEWLDGLVSDRPAVLIDESGHNAVANSIALEIAGITNDTPDPAMGAIDRDPATGDITGFLAETGVGLVLQHMPVPDLDVHKRAVLRAFEELSAYGITSFVDMGVYEAVLETFKALEENGEMPFRADATIMMNDFRGDLPDPDPLLATGDAFDTHLIDPHNGKFWADGTPVSYTSLLLEPYTSDPSTKGEMTVDKGQLARFVELDQQGLAIRVHAIADGTLREALDAIEAARQANPEGRISHHIGHLMIVHPDDIERFVELNVNAEFSPALWFPNAINELSRSILGDERVDRWQPIKEFVDAGVNVSYGSDWPSGTPDADPWRALEAMVTRKDPKGLFEGQLGEPVDLETGIRILTINGARTMHQDDITGSIEVGKYADFILLDRDLFEISADEIADTKVRRTVFEGQVVYQRS